MNRRVLVLHGPNLNLLGEREPEIYGSTTLAELDGLLAREAEALGLFLETFQSNHEGALIDRIQEARPGGGSRPAEGIILNPGGLTHTSVSLRDAVASVALPVIEVHLSNPFAREPFRHQDYVAPVADGVVVGLGVGSYLAALHALDRMIPR